MKKYNCYIITLLCWCIFSSCTVYAQTNWNLVSLGPNLSDVFFLNEATGFCSGSQGMLIKTTNGGVNWYLRNSGTQQYSMHSISFGDGLHGWIAGSYGLGMGVILSSTDGGENWLNTFLNKSIYTVKFINVSTGWIGGSGGLIRKTTNGGVTWVDQQTNVIDDVADFCFLDSSNGWAVGGNYNVSYGTQLVLKTTDGGLNWAVKQTQNNFYKYSVQFVNTMTGFITGARGKVDKTTNGGESWSSTSLTDSLSFLRSVYFANQNTGWIGTSLIFKTTNCGLNWNLITSVSASYYRSLFFVNEQIGWIVGGSNIICNAIMKSTDGGFSWGNSLNGPQEPLKDLAFINNTTAWAVGDRIYIKSTDSGINWPCPSFHSSDFYRKIVFKNSIYGFIVGGIDEGPQGGAITLRTTNGGLNWIVNWSDVVYNYNDAYISNSLAVFSVGYSSYPTDVGIIARRNDINSNWQTIYSIPLTPLKAIDFPDNGLTGWVVGSKGTILKSTNAGANWFQCQTPTSKTLQAFDFINSNTGWAVGDTGTIIKTVNGETWQLQNSNTMEFLFDVKFVNENIGWVVGSNGQILYTTNGGSNWSLINNMSQYDLYSVNFTDINNGWITGNHGIIFKTTNCGGLVSNGYEPKHFPLRFSLSQNYPNPFNPKSNIKFQIAKSGLVKLVVFDALGQEISQLVNEPLSPGTYEVEWDGTNYPSGVYFYKLITADYSETRKMVLVK